MNWKKVGRRLLVPSPTLLALTDLIAAALLAYGFVVLEPEDAMSIASYILSF